MTVISPFSGLGPDALDFLAGLDADNSKSYFDAHRGVYDDQLALPMKSLVVAVGEQLTGRVGPGVRAEPKVGRSLFRINRDLRFSKDKTPYHPYVDAVFWDGDSPRTSPGFILRIAADEVVVGAGVFGLDRAALTKFRDAVVADDPGAALDTAVGQVERSLPGVRLSAPTRARVPKGYPADHPRAEMLRRDSVHLSIAAAPPASITTSRFATWVADRYVKLAPFERWLVEHVG